MRCEELLRLLNLVGRICGDPTKSDSIATHIRSCPCCSQGLIELTQDLLTADMLSCDQCRVLFPDYYEATHPEYPLVTMPDKKISQVLFHLAHCASCPEEYREFVRLSKLEENGEL